MAVRPAGPVEVRARLRTRRLTLVVRTVVAPTTAFLAIAVSPHPAASAMLAVLFLAWHAVLAWGVLRGHAPVVAAVDLAVLTLACVAQLELLPPQYWYTGAGWVVATTSTAVITAQGYLPPAGGALFAVALAVVFVGAAAQQPGGDWAAAAPHAAWLLVEASLGRVLMVVVGRSGRRVDFETARASATEQRLALATARRDDARYQAALLHDTVAATLTAAAAASAVGRAGHGLVAAQARHDLALLDRGDLDPGAGRPGGGAAAGDSLLARIVRVADQAPLDVTVRSDAALPVLPETVVWSIVAATREALRNVERHAGVRRALLTVSSYGSHGVELSVTDQGQGFDPRVAVPHRAGIVLSIEERMRHVGGRACVTSSPGTGTRVLLTWPGADEAPHG